MPADRSTPKHRAEAENECEICGKNIGRYSDMPRHMKTHDPNAKVPCPFEGCGFRTLQKSNLETHIRRHTGEKPFACTDDPDCHFSTPDAASLLRHRKRYHDYVPGSAYREREYVKPKLRLKSRPNNHRQRSAKPTSRSVSISPRRQRQVDRIGSSVSRKFKGDSSLLLDPIPRSYITSRPPHHGSPAPRSPCASSPDDFPTYRSPSYDSGDGYSSTYASSPYDYCDSLPYIPQLYDSPPHSPHCYNSPPYVRPYYDSPPHVPRRYDSPPYVPRPYDLNYPPYGTLRRHDSRPCSSPSTEARSVSVELPGPNSSEVSDYGEWDSIECGDEGCDMGSTYSASTASSIQSRVSSVRSSLAENGSYTTSAFMMLSHPTVVPKDVLDDILFRSRTSPGDDTDCEGVENKDMSRSESFLFSVASEPKYQVPYVQATYSTEFITGSLEESEEPDYERNATLFEGWLVHLLPSLLPSLLPTHDMHSAKYLTFVNPAPQPQPGALGQGTSISQRDSEEHTEDSGIDDVSKNNGDSLDIDSMTSNASDSISVPAPAAAEFSSLLSEEYLTGLSDFSMRYSEQDTPVE